MTKWQSSRSVLKSKAILVLAGFACLLAPLVVAAPPLEDRDPAFVAGRAALEDGLYDLAQKKFEEFIRKSYFRGKRALGALYLVQALSAQGKHEEIATWLAENKRLTDDTAVAGGLTYWLAKAQFDLARADEALLTLEGFETRFPTDPSRAPAERLRAEIYRSTGRTNEALAAYARAASVESDDAFAVDNLLAWSSLLLEGKMKDDAEDILRRVLKNYPDTPGSFAAKLWLGQMLVERKDCEEATKLLESVTAATEVAPDMRAGALIGLSACHIANSNLAEAASNLQQADALATEAKIRVQSRIDRARVLRDMNRTDEAVALLEETIRTFTGDPGLGPAQMDLAKLLLQQRHFTKALDAFQRYLEAFTDPEGEAQALIGRSWCLWELGRFAEAAASFERSYEVLKSPAEREMAMKKAGDAYFANGQYKLALEKYREFREAYMKSPQLPEVLFQLAECEGRLGEFENAEAGFVLITDQYPESPLAESAVFRLAALKEQQGKWDEAARHYDDFMLMHPKSSQWVGALLGRGQARYRAGQFEMAYKDFGEVLDMYPATEWAEQAFYLRGWCLYMTGDTAKALQLCRQFVETLPQSRWVPDVRFWLAEQLFNAKEYDKAEAAFLEIVSLHPASELADDAFYWAGRSAMAANDYRRSITHFNDMLKTFTNSSRRCEARFAQGDALSELGEFSGAILAFDDVVKSCAGSPIADRAMGRKGDCQYTLGADKAERYQEALASYQSVLDSPLATADVRMQGEFKMGRCLEKLGRRTEALEHYMNVVYNWLLERDAGNEPDVIWFTRSAFGAAALKESEGRWDEALRIYQRVVDAGVPASPDARNRIEKIRNEKQPRQA